MIELTYINEGVSERKYFETWKSLDKFVMSKKINRYKVKGQSPRENIIRRFVRNIIGGEEKV